MKIVEYLMRLPELDAKARTIHFPSYADYIQHSLHWHIFRRMHIGRRCFCCNEFREFRLELHHHNYDRLGCELPDDVVTVCRWCHETIGEWVRLKRVQLRDAHHILKAELGARFYQIRDQQMVLPYEDNDKAA